jgi:hypothetical protein
VIGHKQPLVEQTVSAKLHRATAGHSVQSVAAALARSGQTPEQPDWYMVKMKTEHQHKIMRREHVPDDTFS